MTVTTTTVLNKLDKSLFYLESDEQEDGLEETEITNCITSASSLAAAYLNLQDSAQLPVGSMIDEAVSFWAAGLLWNMKMNTEAPNYLEDKKGDTEGDKLIQRAKDLLNVFNTEDDGLNQQPVGGSSVPDYGFLR